MRYRNSTPFPTLCFESIGPGREPVYTVVIRATTEIVPGAALRLSDEQLPINLTDRYFGQPGKSSLKYPNDLAPYKPKTDIILNATAYPPDASAGGWMVQVSVGKHLKSLAVTGPRVWENRLFGWTPSSLKPSPKQPLRYDIAFGGTYYSRDEKDEVKCLDAHRGNPVGKGWVSPLARNVLGDQKTYPAAQVYSSRSDLPPVLGKEYPVEGFGAIAPTWASRQRYVGTWEETSGDDAISLPEDFDFLFYNCAHPDLVVPYLHGNEHVHLFNLTPTGSLHFTLPGYRVSVLASYHLQRPTAVFPANLDTLIIEPDEMSVTLVWRATLPVLAGVEGMETRVEDEMAAEEGSEHA